MQSRRTSGKVNPLNFFRRFFRAAAGVMTAASLVCGVLVGAAWYQLPDSFQVTQGKELELQTPGISVMDSTGQYGSVQEVFASPEQDHQATLMLFDCIPVKTVDVTVSDEKMLIPCGTPFGIKMFTNGVMVVGISDIQSGGQAVNPAAQAGIRVGDIITEANGQKINGNSGLSETIQESCGENVTLKIIRGQEEILETLDPAKSDTDGSYKGGVWVRDSTAGIGTVTFYDPETGGFGGLGHGICDVDTAELMPLGSGEIVPVIISGVTRGEKGRAGELRGYFSSEAAIGVLTDNTESGVYGLLNTCPSVHNAVKLAMKQEVRPGPAKILATVDYTGPQYYDIMIEKVSYREDIQTKNLVIRVTDERLLKVTGGIVQGMSGGPIIQNGMLAGAVTHVFVNDPTRGYGIFAENMVNGQ